MRPICVSRRPRLSWPACWLATLALLVAGTAAATPPVLTMTGTAVNEYFGWAVASVGDVNADGRGDLIASAHNNDVAGVDAGAVYVHFGGQSTDNVADLVLHGTAAGEHFGISVDRAGDVNGDGYADLIVGASGNAAAGTEAGAAYVFFGGPGLDATPDVVLTGAAAGDRFGYSVAGAGDVNGDGYGDVLVGAYNNDAGGSNAGRAYVFYGGASPDAVADLTLTGLAAADWFGLKVAGAGDVNGDGYGDVIVAATGNDAAGLLAGAAYVFCGGVSPDATADLTLLGAAAGDRFGSWVSGAGDVNGDGWSDVVVGAPMHDGAGVDAGAAYVFFGGLGADAVADMTLNGAAAGDWFGSAVASALDLNSDGYGDVVVGAFLNDAGGADAGAAYVYYGGATPDAMADITLKGAAAGDAFGYAVGATGGFDSHLLASLVIGADGSDLGAANAGAVYVYSPSPPAAAQRPTAAVAGAAAGDLLGRCVGAAGDVNGDGYDDVVVGAHRNDAGGTDAGAAYVRFGGPAPPPDLALVGAAAGDLFGLAVAAAGDVNGDGYGDVIVGAPYNDATASDAGSAYVYYGGASPDGTADLALRGASTGDRFGYSVGGAGDVNGDGYGDVIVGAPYSNPNGGDSGSAMIYLGGASPDATADLTFAGEAGGDYFGLRVAGAGDVDDDGFADVVVGAFANDAGGTDAGRVYLFRGGTSPDAAADLTLTGIGPGYFLGLAVAGAGDVNGDGYADVIVGAQEDDAGLAYVYHGGASLDGVADLVLRGVAGGDRFGYAVGAAGDVNQDGYGDLVVGAPYNGDGGTDAGAAYVFYGGLVADATADVVLLGAAPGDMLGVWAGTAGDVRGDGFADVIVGAMYDDTGGADAGAAYVHDFNRYFVTAPNGGETWSVNGPEQVTWLGAEAADVWLSTDGGNAYDVLALEVGGGESNSAWVTAPAGPSTQAVVKVAPHEVSWMTGFDVSDSLFRIVDPSAGVDGPGAHVLRLSSPRPNPAAGAVRLELALPVESVVSVSVFDLAGREVARPIAGERFAAGSVTREWRPAGLAPGVYTVRARVGDVKLTQRLVWLGGR